MLEKNNSAPKYLYQPLVLIVDDQPENLTILEKILTPDVNVVLAQSGEAALRIAQNDRPELILLDIMMPDMDGYQVIKALKADQRTADIPVIFITALADSEDEIKGLDLGAVDYLVKPIRPQITRHRVHQQLQSMFNHRLLHRVINGVNEPVMVLDLDYRVRLMNEPARRRLKRSHVADPMHPRCHEISHHRDTPCESQDHICPLRELVTNDGLSTTVIHTHFNCDNEPKYVELTCSPIFDFNNRLRGVIETSHDVTALLKIQENLKESQLVLDHLAHHDMLTGLPNRLLFQDRLSQAVDNANRTGSLLALMVIDLDRFKEINDSLGHEAGDGVLKTVSRRLRECLRERDILARLGGDEFGVIVESLVKVDDASLLAQKLLKVLQEPIVDTESETKLYVTTSIGVSLYPQDGIDGQSLLSNADAAMYRAKSEGRDNFQYYTEELTARARDRVSLLAELNHAIHNDQLVLYYQPKIDLNSGQISGLEALVRWEHPIKGLIPPFNFIPIAEESGLIAPLGEWVLRSAAHQIVRWHEEGHDIGVVSVNISGRQLQGNDLISTLKEILEQSRCKPEWLEFEITESYIMNQPEVSISLLNQIRRMGISLSIDDFGTGYSSMAYLKKLPVQTLKIDRAFVMDIPDDQEDSAIARAIIALGKSLEMHILAEGIETEEQSEFICSAGCDYGQGYLFSRPLPVAQLTDFFIHRNG